MTTGNANRIAGIDGCRAGWFVVSADEALDGIEWFVAATIEEACLDVGDCAAIGIDIPIGLPDRGSRDCDLLARRLLSPHRTASVFPAPIRPILGVRNYREACDLRESIEGKRMSAQAFHIVAKVEEVDAFLRSKPDTRLFEAHPELAFAVLNGGEAIRPPKRRTPGFELRHELLAPIAGSESLDEALAAYPRKQVARDDVLDAFAVLLTAQRIVKRNARRVPAEPVIDSAGLDMAIWY